MIGFSVIERAPGAANGPLPGVSWRTCVREITFVEADAAAVEPGALHDEAAYAHLLEVICGLDSPMFGETEVMHQFKQFADGLAQGPWRELSQMLLADARTVRSRHLIGLGSRSYGSAVRRHLRDCSRVALVGTGILAREVVTFLADGGRQIDQWGRRESFATIHPSVTYRRLDDRRAFDDAVALVIAAPVSSLDIVGLASRYREVSVLIDLRAEGVQDPAPAMAPIVTLADVFDEVKRAERSVDGRVSAAKAEIRRHARAFATRAKLNPSGWHDLCA